MDLPRGLAYALSLNRVAFGLRYLAEPTAAGHSWIGPRAARRGSSQVFARAIGARDLALAGGALGALRAGRDAEAARWMAAHALADATDLAATAAASGDLPRVPSRIALAVAGASTAVAVAAAAGLARAASARSDASR